MKISIITATYNSAKTLKSCLYSVWEQDYSQLEHIVIDGNSSDATMDIIDQFLAKEERLIALSEKDNGIYDALNKGIARSTGDVIGFVHSDDFLSDPSILSKIMKLLKEKELDGVYGDLDYVDSNNTTKIIRAWKSCNFHPNLISKGWMPAHPTLFLKKEVYKKHGDFDTSYNIAADYDLMLRIFKDQSLKFDYLPEVITKMRIGGVSNGNIENMIKKSKEDYRVLKSNNIRSPLKVLFQKNLSKIHQFF